MVNPHLGGPPVVVGAPLDRAVAVSVLVHGRDQGPGYLIDALVSRLDPHLQAEVCFVLPEAAGGSWYPARFSEPLLGNEPHLSLALEALRTTIEDLRRQGVPAGRVVLAGFSQGACLVAESLWRNPRAYGGAAILTGALMGSDTVAARARPDLRGLPLLLATGRGDAWLPLASVETTADAFRSAGATVEVAVYDESEHGIYPGEVAALGRLLERAGNGEHRDNLL